VRLVGIAQDRYDAFGFKEFGALLGGFLAGLVLSDTIGLIGSFILAFLGAVVLLWLLRLLGSRQARA